MMMRCISLCKVCTSGIRHVIPDYDWEMVKDFILLRQFIDRGRAHPRIREKKWDVRII